MELTVTQIVLAGAILTLGMGLQGIVGFGVALFAIPLLLLVGIPLPLAVSLLPVTTCVQTGWNAWHARQHIPWGPVVRVSAWRLLGLPAGILLMALLIEAGDDVVKQVIGGVLLVVIAIQLAARVKARDRVHWVWDIVAGTTSGIMVGSVGMGGPPVVLYAQAYDWPARTSRAFLWATFLAYTPPWVALLLWKFGRECAWAMLVSCAYVPTVVLAAHLGAKLGDRLNRKKLRVIAFGILVVIALAAIAGPWLKV